MQVNAGYAPVSSNWVTPSPETSETGSNLSAVLVAVDCDRPLHTSSVTGRMSRVARRPTLRVVSAKPIARPGGERAPDRGTQSASTLSPKVPARRI